MIASSASEARVRRPQSHHVASGRRAQHRQAGLRLVVLTLGVLCTLAVLRGGGIGVAVLIAASPGLVLLVRNRQLCLLTGLSGVLLFSLSIPVVRLGLGPLTLTNQDLSLYGLIAASFIWSHDANVRVQRLPPPAAAFLGLVALSATLSITLGHSVGVWADVRPVLGSLCFLAVTRARVAPMWHQTALLLTRLAILAIGFAGLLVLYSLLAQRQMATPFGLVDPPIHLARSGAEPLLILTAPYLVARLSGWRRFLIVAFLVILLLASQTLSIVAAGLLVWVATQSFYRRPFLPSRRRSRVLVAAAAMAAVGVLVLGSSPALDGLGRFNPARVQSDSAKYRVEETRSALKLITRSPTSVLLGSGPGSTLTFGGASNSYTGYQVITKADTHNFYLNIQMKYGVIALSLVLWWLVWIARKLRRAGDQGWALGLGLLALGIVSVTAPFLWTLQGFTILGLLTAIAHPSGSASSGKLQRREVQLA